MNNYSELIRKSYFVSFPFAHGYFSLQGAIIRLNASICKNETVWPGILHEITIVTVNKSSEKTKPYMEDAFVVSVASIEKENTLSTTGFVHFRRRCREQVITIWRRLSVCCTTRTPAGSRHHGSRSGRRSQIMKEGHHSAGSR